MHVGEVSVALLLLSLVWLRLARPIPVHDKLPCLLRLHFLFSNIFSSLAKPYSYFGKVLLCLGNISELIMPLLPSLALP